MIDIQHLTYRYGKKKEPVFEDFSLKLEPGNIYGLLGKNGTGKSTLLYLITGLLFPQSGHVLYNDIDTFRRLPVSLEEIFLLPEEFELPNISLKNYVKLNATFYPRFSHEILSTCLSDFGMDENVRFGELSMGQQKKAYMSFALATNTQLLIMDEPSNGLDIPSKSQFRKVVASGMTDDKTIIISTHQVRDVDTLLDHIVIIDGTQLLLNRSVEEICSHLSFRLCSDDDDNAKALYIQAALGGNFGVFVKKDTEEETKLDLELLFNALLTNREPMLQVFNPKSTEE